MIKRQIRILGIDDGPFKFDEEKVIIVGVVMRANGYLEGVLRREIEVDGRDSTERIMDMIENTRHRNQIRVIMLDGIALGGFNVVDIDGIYRRSEIPVITITREEPDFESMLKTLKRRFPDWEDRWRLIKDNTIYEIKTPHNPIYISCKGISPDEAKEIIRISTIRGAIPEPIRVAHMIASGIVRGESYGKA